MAAIFDLHIALTFAVAGPRKCGAAVGNSLLSCILPGAWAGLNVWGALAPPLPFKRGSGGLPSPLSGGPGVHPRKTFEILLCCRRVLAYFGSQKCSIR